MLKQITYKNLSKRYNEFHGQPDNYFELQLEKIKKYLNMKKNKTYLDVGCGAGRLLIPLNKEFNVEGLDVSEHMLDECAKQTNKKVKLYYSSFNDFKPTKQYDGIYFSMSLHQMEKQEMIIKKALKMLKKDGILLIITVNHNQFNEILLNKFSKKLDKIDRKRFIDVNKFFNLINKSKIITIETHNLYQYINKNKYIEMIKNKYISSLQLIDESELNNIVNNIKQIKGKTICVPDCYTYVVVKK